MTAGGLAELYQLGRDLGDVAETALPNVRKALQVTARGVKDDWNEKLFDEGHAQRTGRAITYDTQDTSDGASAEIGAVRGSGQQAYIVRLLELGSANNGAHGYGAAALDENEDDFQHGLDLAIRSAESEAGL